MSADMDIFFDGNGSRILNRTAKAAASHVCDLARYRRRADIDTGTRARMRRSAVGLVLWGGFALNAGAQTIVEYIHTDALGSLVAITDASGIVIKRQVYESYGAAITQGTADAPGFAGHVWDSATNLSYMQQRYYDEELGRFLSVDPVAADGDVGANFSRYKYAHNNPYRFTDPDGRCEKVTGSAICDGGGFSGSRVFGGGPPSVRDTGTSSPSPSAASRNSAGDKGFYMLPQDQGEGGFYNYGTPAKGAGQYGTGGALSAIFLAGHAWSLSGHENSFGVGNMSLKDGGPFPPHSSHRNGTDIDVRPMNSQGLQVGGVSWRSPIYDRAATQELVDTFYSTGLVRQIFFNDPRLEGVKPLAGHDDHLHIQVQP